MGSELLIEFVDRSTFALAGTGRFKFIDEFQDRGCHSSFATCKQLSYLIVFPNVNFLCHESLKILGIVVPVYKN
jgi:hypothetical protein